MVAQYVYMIKFDKQEFHLTNPWLLTSHRKNNGLYVRSPLHCLQ